MDDDLTQASALTTAPRKIDLLIDLASKAQALLQEPDDDIDDDVSDDLKALLTKLNDIKVTTACQLHSAPEVPEEIDFSKLDDAPLWDDNDFADPDEPDQEFVLAADGKTHSVATRATVKATTAATAKPAAASAAKPSTTTTTARAPVPSTAAVAVPPRLTLAVTGTIKYAPQRTPVTGTFNVCFIALQWNNGHGEKLQTVSSVARQTAQVYNQISGGRVTFNVTSKSVQVPFPRAPKYLNRAENFAKSAVDAARKSGKYDHYMIYNDGTKQVSEGSGDTAHLSGTLVRDSLHEMGHCAPFRLGHAGKYVEEHGKEVLWPYGDGTSFMGSGGNSRTITAPQFYFLGWLAREKVAQYDAGDPATDYNIELLMSSAASTNLKAVRIPRTGRDLFLSLVPVDGKRLFALHLQNDGGSQRVAVFNSKCQYEGLTFTRQSVQNGYATMRIAPSV